MMRPGAKGLSLAVDPFGRELAQGEYYSTDRLDIVAMMPVQAQPTLYSRIGDVVAYASILVLIALPALAFVPGRWRPPVGGTPTPAHD